MELDPTAHPSHLVLERPVRERPGAIAGVREPVLTLGSRVKVSAGNLRIDGPGQTPIPLHRSPRRCASRTDRAPALPDPAVHEPW
jgi:hypothetical protein